MRLSVAIAAGLAVGIGVGWWLLRKDAPPAAAPVADGTARPAEATRPGPRLYRWRDAQGVLQVSDKPPAGQAYEEVTLRDDQNVVPMSGAAPAPVTTDD